LLPSLIPIILGCFDKKPVVSGEDGLKALRVAEIIIQKIEESKIKA